MKWNILSFLLLLAAPCIRAQTVTATFETPNQACTGEPISINNTSTSATTYHWNFCAPNTNVPPAMQNLGNFNGLLDQPVFMDYVHTGNDYYAFVTNYKTGNLVRLDFGNSLLNTPTATNLGNFSGTLPSVSGNGGLQIVQNNGQWYVIIVAGYPPGGANPRLVTISFGPNITNPTPAARNWGNVGNMYDPRDFQLINENNKWYGFTVNAETETITELFFGNNFDNAPLGNNLGNLGNLAYPLGLYAMNDAGFWRLFITNGFDDTRVNGFYTITRLDFKNSLENLPAATNLGNLGNSLQDPQDMAIIKSCDKIFAYVLNGHPQYNDFLQLDFNDNIENIPAPNLLHAVNDMDFPYCLTRFEQIGDEFYAFVVNRGNNTISRVGITNCTNASIATSTDKNPPPISYNHPGKYVIRLTVDEGLPTESSLCKEIEITACYDSIIVTNDTTICAGTALQLQTLPATSYKWTPAADLDDPSSPTPITNAVQSITYYVEATTEGNNESIIDSIHITVRPAPQTSVSDDTTVCIGTPVQLNATGGTNYLWSPATGLDNAAIANPIAVTTRDQTYTVKISGNDECTVEDSVKISVRPRPQFTGTGTVDICEGMQVMLTATGGDEYLWSSQVPISDIHSPTITSNPSASTVYNVNIHENVCDYDTTISLQVKVHSIPELSSLPNAFTPNGDGKNDCFGITQWGDSKIEQFTIYNRWGQPVFETKQAGDCWDGTAKGTAQPSGTYVYIIRALTVCGFVSHKGMVTLVR
jgi:gliding motility-associated-like protein